jgi:DNA-binding beta-propeller fold protein YncE
MAMAETMGRRTRGLVLTVFVVAVCLADTVAVADRAAVPLPFNGLFRLVGDYPLGLATSRTDYESFDPTTARLYIANMGAGRLLVFDTEKDELLAQRDGFAKITGVLAVPELHRLYASVPGGGPVSALVVGLGMLGLSSGAGRIVILDTSNLTEVARLPGGVFPDGIAYDSADVRIFVSDEFGGALTALDVKSNRVLARIALEGEAGNVQYDRVTGRVYAAVQSRNELAVIDPTKLAVTGRIKLMGCKHPHGLAIAPDAAVAYVACDENDVLMTIDLAAARVLRVLPLAHDPGVLAIDAGTGRLYVASESGNLSTFSLKNNRALTPIGDVFVGEGAHAVAVDPITHRLYIPLADLRGRCVLRVLLPEK